mmetsp:Transcript_4943/g.12620  ORF Transcript_4943/g.12620 Transcript_4943/m.12620 type:complete len:203 (-) Transcript_4943:304-912(-)
MFVVCGNVALRGKLVPRVPRLKVEIPRQDARIVLRKVLYFLHSERSVNDHHFRSPEHARHVIRGDAKSLAAGIFELHEDHGVHSVLCQVEVVLLLVLLAAAAEEGDALDDKVDDPVEEVGLLQRAGPGLGVGQPHDLDLIGHPRVRREGDGGPHVPLPTSRVVAGDEVVALPLEKAVQRPRPLLRHLLQADDGLPLFDFLFQ